MKTLTEREYLPIRDDWETLFADARGLVCVVWSDGTLSFKSATRNFDGDVMSVTHHNNIDPETLKR